VHISQHRFAEGEAISARGGRGWKRRHPPSGTTWGITLYFQRRWSEAIAALQKARDLGLRSPDNLRYLTFAWHHAGDTRQAMDSCNAWLAAAPQAAAHGYHALLLMDEGDMNEAVKAAEESLAQDPEDDNAHIVLGMWSGRDGRTSTPPPDASSAWCGGTRTNCRGWLGIALVQLYRGQYARLHCQLQARAGPSCPGTSASIVAMGWRSSTNTTSAAAEATFRQAIAIERNFGEAHGGLASSLGGAEPAGGSAARSRDRPQAGPGRLRPGLLRGAC
jgi:tetratricopeptide (TPR) repeat protein